jgi:hypothetical protein
LKAHNGICSIGNSHIASQPLGITHAQLAA